MLACGTAALKVAASAPFIEPTSQMALPRIRGRRLVKSRCVLSSIAIDSVNCCLALAHHHQEVIAYAAQHGPAGGAAVETPQPLMPAQVPLADPQQVGRRRENAYPTKVDELEVAAEWPIELARCVIARPDCVPIHPDGHHAARVAHAGSRPASAQQVVADLPRADAADHRKDQPRAGFEEACALARHAVELRQTVHGSQS